MPASNKKKSPTRARSRTPTPTTTAATPHASAATPKAKTTSRPHGTECSVKCSYVPSNAEWSMWMARLAKRTQALTANRRGVPVGIFRTAPRDLWSIYMRNIPAHDRQHHNCRTCRQFIERFGNLVTVQADGTCTPLVWLLMDSPEYYRAAVLAMRKAVVEARITGPFLPHGTKLGEIELGGWAHLGVTISTDAVVEQNAVRSHEQREAQIVQNHDTLDRAIGTYPHEIVTAAMRIAKTGVMHRHDQLAATIEWFRDYRSSSDNVRWYKARFAFEGAAHIASGVAGAFMDDVKDVESGRMLLTTAIARHNARVAPDKYMRPTAAPAEGAIDTAERIFAKMNLASALRRRFATVRDIPLWRWKPSTLATTTRQTGVFRNLREQSEGTPYAINGGVWTWARFVREILPNARRIQALVSPADAFGAFATAADPTAPPILRWDREGQRNPVSWYTYTNGSTATEFGLVAGAWASVAGISSLPPMWYSDPGDDDRGFLMVLAGAVDRRRPGSCLFPEFLRHELHEVRSVIEAHSNKTALEQPRSTDQRAAGLLRTSKSWPLNIRLRVNDGSTLTTYTIDRME